MKNSVKSIAFLALLIVSGLLLNPSAAQSPQEIRWDVISFESATVNPGGVATALANDRSQITLTSSGSFVVPQSGEEASAPVSGGGSWKSFDPSGVSTGSGTYTVRQLLRWAPAPGSFSGVVDNIGLLENARAGLIHVRVDYSDGSDGIVTISCHLFGAPDAIFEGITASKGFIDYWNRVPPVVGINANRTLLHVQ